MNQNFVEYVKSHIKEYLPMEYQNAVVSINEVTRSNDRLLTGLTILSPGERSAPTIYLEALAEQVEQGLPLDAAMKQIEQIQGVGAPLVTGDSQLVQPGSVFLARQFHRVHVSRPASSS